MGSMLDYVVDVYEEFADFVQKDPQAVVQAIVLPYYRNHKQSLINTPAMKAVIRS